jgi:hypothetical protein
MVAARLANMKQGARTDLRSSANLPEVSQPTAAAMLNVSERLVHSAKAVQESSAAPELQRAVERGEGTVTTAADLSALPVEQQDVARGEQEILRAQGNPNQEDAPAACRDHQANSGNLQGHTRAAHRPALPRHLKPTRPGI